MRALLNRVTKKICFVSVIVLVFILASCAQRQEQVRKVEIETVKPIILVEKSLLEEINEKKEKGSYKEIIEIYEKRKDEFTSIELLKPVFISYLVEKRFDDIIKLGEERLSRFASMDDKEISLMLGISYFERGSYEASRRVLSALYDSGFKNEVLNIYLAMIYQKRNHFALALSVAGEIGSLDKRNYLQGLIFFSEGNYEKALDRLKSVKDINAKVYVLYCLYYLNRHDEALRYFEENRDTLRNEAVPIISTILINRGDVKKARDLLESVPEGERKGSFYRNLGLIYDIYFDDKGKAKELYQKYLREVKDEEVNFWLSN